MALSNTQIVTVAEIIQETYETAESLASSLNAEQEVSVAADITLWGTIRDSHVKLKGGSKGVDFDNERKRNAIRQRVRKALGLSLVSEERSCGDGSSALANVFVF